MRKLLSTALVALLLAPGTASADLVAHLPFDGNTDDASGNGNHGTFVGDAAGPNFVEGYDGTEGGAIQFDGSDDRVDVTQAVNLPLTDQPAFSIAMWVKGDGVAFDDKRVFSEGSSGSNTPLFNLGTTPGTSDGPQLNSFLRPGPAHRKTAGTAFDGEWHHIAWVDQDGNVTVYIDGVRDTANLSYTRQLTGLDRTTIGAILRAGPCCNFNGAIDDVRLYNHALTQDEVRDLIPTAGCPEEGDTHCTGIAIVSAPLGNGPGAYQIEATGSDDSGDAVIFEVEILDADGRSVSFTRGDSATLDLLLDVGSLTIVVTADDDLACFDQADDAICTLELEIGPADPICVSHWALDGNLLDSSPQANHGTFNDPDGSGENYVEGFDGTPNGALSFDGVDDIVSCGHNAGLPIYYNPAYTVTFWVKGDGTGQNDLRMFSEGSTASGTPLLNLGTQQGGGDKVVAYVRMDGTNVSQGGSTSARSALDNEWHHVAWVDDNGQCKWYIDGILDATMPSYTRDPLIPMDTTSIGGILRASPSHWFAGAIDEVRVYNYALDEAAIQAMVPEADDCDGESDTTCDGLFASAPPGQIAGNWTFTADASDGSGDSPLLYSFEVIDSEGESVGRSGPSEEPSATFNLGVGEYRVLATIDDRLDCFDAVSEPCALSVSVNDVPLFTSIWKLDGDLADSGNFIGGEDNPGNDGTWNGDNDPVFVDGYDCAEGGAVTQSGDGQGETADDMIVVNSNIGLPLWDAGAFTISIWVRGEPQNDKRIWSESNRSGNNNTLFNIGTGNNAANNTKLDFFLRNDSGSTAHFLDGGNNHRYSTTPVFDGTWHHVCWVDDGGDVTCYIDGVADATDFDYTRPTMTIDTTTIGGILRAGGTCCEFAGDIDQVQVFNFVLTGEEVEELCNETAPQCCPQEGDDDFADTTCDGITVQAIGDDPRPTMFTAQAFGLDGTGDDITYVFSATSPDHDEIVLPPQSEDTATFDLLPGEWTISASVDDDPDCDDASASAVCSANVTVLPPCPTEGDTHCSGIDVSDNEGPGVYTFVANATDDSGDEITYTWVAIHPAVDPPMEFGPSTEPTAEFLLPVDGEWLIRCTVDDDADCDDRADDAVCSVVVNIQSGVGPFIRGDANGDGNVELADAIFLFNFLFLGGAEPSCQAAADSASEGALNLTGGVYTLSFLFTGGPAPASPFPACGRSTTESDAALGCESYTACGN